MNARYWLALGLGLAASACRGPDPAGPDPAPTAQIDLEAATRTVVQSFEGAMIVPQTGHSGGISSLSFDASGEHLLSVGYDETARVWDLGSGAVSRVLAPVASHNDVRLLELDRKLALIGGGYQPLEAWHLDTGEHQPVQVPEISYPQWTVDGRHATHFDGRKLRVWSRDGDAVSGEPRQLDIMNAEELLDGGELAVVSADDWLRLDPIGGGQAALKLEGIRGCAGRAGPCHLSARGGGRIVAVSKSGRLLVHDSGGIEPVATIEVGEAELAGIVPDGTLVLVLDRQVALLLDVERGEQVASFRAGAEYLSSAALSADGKRVALGSALGIRVFDVAQGAEIFRASARAPRQAGAAISPDGRTVWLAMDGDGRQWVERWDLDLVARVDRRDVGEAMHEGFSSSGLVAVSSGEQVWWYNARGYLERLDLERGQTESRAHSPSRWIAPERTEALLEPSHGRWMAAMSSKDVTVFDAEGRTLGRREFPHRLMSITETSAGFTLVDADRQVHELRVGDTVELVKSSAAEAAEVAFTASGMRLQASHRGEVTRAPTDANAPPRPCGAPVDEVIGHFAASPDARWVVTEQYDGKVRVWDCDEGALRHTFEFAAGRLEAVHFAASAPVALLTGRSGISAVVALDSGKRLELVTDGRDWAAVGSRSQFSGSGGAARLLAASDGIDARSIDQYAVHLNRPDRLMEWWGSPREDAITFYRAVARRRLERSILRVPDHAPAPPVVELRAVEVEDGARAKLDLVASDPQGARIEVRVFVDGVPAATLEGEGSPMEAHPEIALTPGRNLIEVSATNEFGLESARARSSVDPSATRQDDQLTISLESSAKDAVFSVDGEHLITLDGNGVVRWYRGADGKEIRQLRAHPRGQALALSDDGKELFVIGADDGGKPLLRAFDADTGAAGREYTGIPWPIYDLVVTETHVIGSGGVWGERFGDTRGGVVVWRIGESAPRWRWDKSASVATRIERVPGTAEDFFVPLAAVEGAGRWRAAGPAEPTIIPTQKLRAVGVAPGGARLAVETEARELGIIDVESGELVARIGVGQSRIRRVRWLDGQRVLVETEDHPPTIYAVDAPGRGSAVGTRPVNELVLAPSGGRLALLDFDAVDVRPLAGAMSVSERSKLFFIGIGVSDYADDRLDLGLAAEDARGLAEAFGRLGGFDEVSTHAFVDGEVGRDVFGRVAGQLADAGLNDLVVVFIAGHGKTLTDGEPGYFFLPSDVKITDLRGSAIPFEELEAVLAAVPSRRKLLLLDTCESGEPDTQPRREGLDRARARGLSVRGLELAGPVASPLRREGGAIRKAFTLERDRFIFRNTERRSGAVVFSAAGASEYALEDPRLGHGLFTAGLLEVLGTRAADDNHDGRVEISELERAVRHRVASWSDGAQNPRIDRENIHARISFPATD